MMFAFLVSVQCVDVKKIYPKVTTANRRDNFSHSRTIRKGYTSSSMCEFQFILPFGTCSWRDSLVAPNHHPKAKFVTQFVLNFQSQMSHLSF